MSRPSSVLTINTNDDDDDYTNNFDMSEEAGEGVSEQNLFYNKPPAKTESTMSDIDIMRIRFEETREKFFSKYNLDMDSEINKWLEKKVQHNFNVCAKAFVTYKKPEESCDAGGGGGQSDSCLEKIQLKKDEHKNSDGIYVKDREQSHLEKYKPRTQLSFVFDGTEVNLYPKLNIVEKNIFFDYNEPNVLFNCILEVSMQQLALEIKREKNVDIIIPEIYEIRIIKTETPEVLAFRCLMEYIPVFDFRNEKNREIFDDIMKNCKFWIDKIKQAFKPFRDNHFFHNDTHSLNLCFTKTPTGELSLVLIDYGKATLHNFGNQNLSSFYEEITCDDNSDSYSFRDWLLYTPLGIDKMYIMHDVTRYGGNHRQKNKKTTSNKRKKRRTTKKNRSQFN